MKMMATAVGVQHT